VGSTVEIRRQNEENNDLSKHSTAKKNGGGTRLGYVPLLLPLPGLLQIATPRNGTTVLSITDAPFKHESTVHL
jgi:hypothetical protein